MRAAERIAEQLAKSFSADFPSPTPSIEELAETWNVSYYTMWRAIRLLAQQGIITRKRGKRIAPGPELSIPRVPSAPTETKAVGEIRARMESGQYPVGRPLPTMSVLAEQLQISKTTVNHALKDLQIQHKVHKRGRKWIAGGKSLSDTRPEKSSKNAPVVLVLLYEDYSLHKLYNPPTNHRFLDGFFKEIFSAGYQVIPVKQGKGYPYSSIPIGGLDQIQTHIVNLGVRYSGTLIIHGGALAEESYDRFVPMLCGFNKPVVLFDPRGQFKKLGRTALGGSRNYFYLSQDDRSAVKKALEYLHMHEHRFVVLPEGDPRMFSWSKARANRIGNVATTLRPPLSIIESRHTEKHWFWNISRPMGATSMEERMISLLGLPPASAGTIRSVRKTILEQSPSLVQPLQNGATALIALNDGLAREYRSWALLVGIRIPEQLSIISFDNADTSVLTPITTVDFGYARLGYRAAHALIGDIALRSDSDGVVKGECTVIDRGSVATPREGSLSL